MKFAAGQESKKAGYKVPFGTVSITPRARQLINEALDSKWVTKGKMCTNLRSVLPLCSA